MGIESGVLKESENKKKKLSENQLKDYNKKIEEHHKMKEKISVEIETENQIFSLKELVEKGVITKETAKKVESGDNVDEETINEIFKKIDKIEDIKDIDKYLPKELRISHNEYVRALHDDIFRVQTLTKLDSALTLLSKQINPDSVMGLNLFSGFLCLLDKNLIRVQEHNIDLKENLEEIDEVKFGKEKDTRSIWQRIIDFLKEVFK